MKADGDRWSRRDVLRLGGAGAMAAVGMGALAPDEAMAAETGAGWHSRLVYPGSDGRLVYRVDNAGNRIPDFSWAGYRNGEVALPNVDVVLEIGPVSGDNTTHIQQALDKVASRPLSEAGFRGALRLKPGTYPVSGTLHLRHSGVVLRGSGKWGDPAVDTVIIGTGSGSVETVIKVGGGVANWNSQKPGTRTDIVTGLVRVGSRSFQVADASNLRVGDNLIITHPHTAAWGAAIDGGGTLKGGQGEPWPVGSRPIIYSRYIQAIDGNMIRVCAPVFNHLDRALSQSYAHVWTQAGLIRNVGVENLRVTMGSPPAEDENHQMSCVILDGVEDAWVKDCQLLQFSYSGVLCRRATRVTVQSVRASHPRSKLVGERRYNFQAALLSQQVLFRDLWSEQARHAFVSNGATTTSGCVWADGYNKNGYTESGGHQRWTHGLLFDNIKEIDTRSDKAWVLNLHNRGHISNHGWSSAHSVLWNCTVDSGRRACVQRPPTAQNYAIGTKGGASGVNWWSNIPAGHIEGTNSAGLQPASLYAAQLADRLG
ncbi:hypothetical protein AB0J35_63005 [Nonomuraea angiospora]|uniref:hypothetical protein n=1 Tax=Nonomuraea angiospora TaxID=46172 RepID=UPI003422B7CD